MVISVMNTIYYLMCSVSNARVGLSAYVLEILFGVLDLCLGCSSYWIQAMESPPGPKRLIISVIDV